MDYLIGKRRKGGDPILWAWTQRGIIRLTDVTEARGQGCRADWGAGSLKDDADNTALAMLAFLNLEHEECGQLLDQFTDMVQVLPYSAWILSRGELEEHLDVYRRHWKERQLPPPPKKKGGKK